LWPLIVTSTAQRLMTLPVGISRLSLAFSTVETQHLILTALVYQVIPMVVVFLYLQRYYIRGFVLSGFGNL
jgi:multiple sugar transport system permease protein